MAVRDIKELVALLEAARDAYYNTDTPLMSDAEYDALEDELRSLAPKHPFLKGVGAKATKTKWAKVKHDAPMGSLLKVNVEKELRAWYDACIGDLKAYAAGLKGQARKDFLARVEAAKLVVSEKLDGASISLVYKDGKLIHALLRGEGDEGEDILPNVLKMLGLQKIQKGFTGWQRGEIILGKKLHAKHLADYKSRRNAAVGICRRESDASACKHLTVSHYQAIRKGGNAIKDKITEFLMLQKRMCATPFFKLVDGPDGVVEIYEEYVEGARAALDYDIDGLVVEFNDPELMEVLGDSSGRPKGARAFKFPHEEKATTLNNVRWQVGLSGRVTPVAEFDGVDLIGATVVQASLANMDRIKSLGLTEGAKILVTRRNDVIPHVEKVLRHATDKKIRPPKHCPTCRTPLVRDGAYIKCPNDLTCPAQVEGNIKRWVKKLGIKDLGDSLIKALVAQGNMREPADLYHLRPNVLASFRTSGKKVGFSAANRIVDNIQATRELPLARFVGSLGIDMCSRSVCETICEAGFDTLGKMVDATVADIMTVPKMGQSKAEAFVEGFKARRNFINNLLDAGVRIKKPVVGKMSGKSFCFTQVRDKDLERQIEAQGGIVKGNFSRGLSYVVTSKAGLTKSGGKLDKARQHGIPIIDVDQLADMLG